MPSTHCSRFQNEVCIKGTDSCESLGHHEPRAAPRHGSTHLCYGAQGFHDLPLHEDLVLGQLHSQLALGIATRLQHLPLETKHPTAGRAHFCSPETPSPLPRTCRALGPLTPGESRRAGKPPPACSERELSAGAFSGRRDRVLCRRHCLPLRYPLQTPTACSARPLLRYDTVHVDSGSGLKGTCVT